MHKIFDVIVSNPPYSADVNKTKNFKHRNNIDLFPLIQEIGKIVGKDTVMIYPATWQKTITKTLGKYLIDNGLKLSITNDGEKVFGNVRVTVSIVHLQDNYNGKIFINDYYSDRKINKWIEDNKQHKLLKVIENYPLLKLPSYKINLRTRELTSLPFTDEKSKDTDIEVWLKAKQGKQPDARPYYMNRRIFKHLYPDYPIEKYRVMVRSRLVGRQALFREMVFIRNTLRNTGNGLQARIFYPFETTGETWKEIAAFDTETEAINFRNYLNTMVIADFAYLDYSSASFFSKVPLLDDYTSNNKIFNNLSIESNDINNDWVHLKHLGELETRLKDFFNL